jgi:hypothetical protein
MALEKATLRNVVTGDPPIPVLFNPEEYTLNRDVVYAQAAIPGLSAPLLQFANGGLQTLDLELLLDTLEAHPAAGTNAGDDVRSLTDRVVQLMDPDPTTHAPPLVLFVWGSLSFECVVARVVQRFLMFKPDGTPVRARLTVTLNECKDLELEAQAIKRETADYTKRHVVGQGESLSSIAAKAYSDPRLWRAIALRNELDDPRDPPTGLELEIPSLPFRDPETGEVYA